MIDGNIRLRWSSEKGVLEQVIELAPQPVPIIRGRLDPWPDYRPKIYDTPPVRPEDPLKEIDGDPSVAKAKRRPRDGGGSVDVRGFGVVSVNVMNQEDSKEIANIASKTETPRS